MKKQQFRKSLIQKIIQTFGSEKKFLDMLREECDGEIDLKRMGAYRWRDLGGVPRKWVFKVAKILRVHPMVLNYSLSEDIYKGESFLSALKSCSHLLSEVDMKIIRHLYKNQ